MSLVRFRFWAFVILKNKFCYGVLAQSVEHLTFNQVVPGSNPGCLTFVKLSFVNGRGSYVGDIYIGLFVCMIKALLPVGHSRIVTL